MAWYDCEVSSCASSDDGDEPKPMCSPYQCTLNIIQSSPLEVEELKDMYTPLLQWIDPAFKIVEIIEEHDEMNHSMGSEGSPRCARGGVRRDTHGEGSGHEEKGGEEGLRTQAMSVVLFLHDTAESELNADKARKYLASEPWEFHHKIALASKIDYRTVARQDYYQLTAALPLWCVCGIHCGHESLRFNIFVRNFDKMVEFYKKVLRKEITVSKEGFCYFNLYSQPGFDIHLSLKYSKFLRPEPLENVILKFKLDDIQDVQPYLVYPLIALGDDRWRTKDPDGNSILLIHDNWSDITWSTRETLSEYSSGTEDECSCCSDEECSNDDVFTDSHESYSDVSDDALTDSAYNSDLRHSVTDG